jgi:imidazolonepropionase
VRHVIDEMLPAVAAQGVARWCDVFCEAGVFTPDESNAILAAGERLGLASRIHANELGSSGGVEVAAARRARSADHLVFVTGDQAHALAARGRSRRSSLRVLLPEARFASRPPARSSSAASRSRSRAT